MNLTDFLELRVNVLKPGTVELKEGEYLIMMVNPRKQVIVHIPRIYQNYIVQDGNSILFTIEQGADGWDQPKTATVFKLPKPINEILETHYNEEVTAEQRKEGKIKNFSTGYGS